MDRTAYNALLAQYRVRELTGDGAVSWDGGVHCVIPEVKLLGKCGQNGTPTPEAPVQVKCNNGTFVVNGQNIFDANTFTQELLSIEGSSQATIDGRNCVRFSNRNTHIYGELIPFHVKENTQYTIQLSIKADGIPTDGSGSIYVIIYYTDGTSTNIFASMAQYAQNWTVATKTTDAGKTIDYLKLSYGTEWYWIIDVGSISMVEGNYTTDTMPPYAPYFDGGTAQAPDLYGIPGTDYRDEWDAQTGRGVRRCAIIESYAGETITTPYISSTGELSDGATVIYGIPDTPFYATPARLTMPPGAGQIIQTGGDVADCPISVKYLAHS